MITKEQINKLSLRKEQLYKHLNISNKTQEANTLENTTQSTDFWREPKEAQKILDGNA